MSLEERLAGVIAVRPELATFNLGTMNYEGFPIPERWPKVESDWERQILARSGNGVFENTLATMREVALLFDDLDVVPELEAYDLGHIATARFLIDEGTLKPPVRLQLVLGVFGGAGNALEDLFVLRQRALSILGEDLGHLSVAAVGYPMQLRHAAVALALGMGCRVGLEDNLRIERDRQAADNAELVVAAKRLSDVLGRPVATPDELRAELHLRVEAQ